MAERAAGNRARRTPSLAVLSLRELAVVLGTDVPTISRDLRRAIRKAGPVLRVIVDGR